MANDLAPLTWYSQFSVAPFSRTHKSLLGDKIILPPSALEQLLSAATVAAAPATAHAYTPTFDPYNPHTYSAERQARELYQETQQQLPHPLTFRLVNPANGHIVYAGIREFSAQDGEVGLSPFLRQAMGLPDEIEADTANGGSLYGDSDVPIANGVNESLRPGQALPRITVHAKQLPKGTYVRLRPLEAGYDPEDWKSLLEHHLRSNFTTLTKGEILAVPGSRGKGTKKHEFKFLVDKFVPEGEGICVVDTDLEVDIEALNEEQAKETLQRRLAKTRRAPGNMEGSSVGEKLELWDHVQGQVLEGDYVDYTIASWDRSQGLHIELGGVNDGEEVDLFVSPLAARQRSRPRDDEFVFGDTGNTYPKWIRLQPTNVELEEAEAMWVSIYGYKFPPANGDPAKNSPRSFYIRVTQFNQAEASIATDEGDYSSEAPGPEYESCKNCTQWVPHRTMILHENFCIRNNVLCPHCRTVFKKSSSEWSNHWHCPHDSAHGNSVSSKIKHEEVSHTRRSCPNCSHEATSLEALAQHRTTLCPGKPILCQFCHLVVPQEGDPDSPNPKALLSGLTPHELADGARTTECHLCSKIIRLRDMVTHLKHHDLQRRNRSRPAICRNVNCGRTLDGVGKNGDVGVASRMGQRAGNAIGLCSICFGPLYVSMYDPGDKALRRRVERRYLTQLLTGCGKLWCRNEYCKSGRKNLAITEENGQPLKSQTILPMVKPFVENLEDVKGSPLHFCVDENSERRRGLAEMMAATSTQGQSNGKGKERVAERDGYDFEWCVAALEAEGGNLDRAASWLGNWAPSRAETRH
ncbi:hypothetical protein FGG08_002799 [Glutinoglossum americanum]|uniref:Ubiquitin-protein ligase E3A N-terminal zinc-binding domain-containing protein n=1 Tax=Glutinoglossum americanum TaxID=1670608 RepID=A0A9P8L476_9PEZI|nr:hypothetical protein FGG08_002799 [Glutinoglossum americanum]